MNTKFLKLDWITPRVLGVGGALFAVLVSFARGIQSTSIQDAEDYVGQAKAMQSGWHFMLANPDSFQRPLGLPSLVLLTFFITKSTSLLAIKLLLALGNGLSAYLMASIGIRIGLNRFFWIAATIFFLLDPFLFFAATDVQTESITTLIVLYWANLYVKPELLQGKFSVHAALFPLTGAFAVIMRPNFLLPFLAIGILVWLKIRQENKYFVISTSLIFGFLLASYEFILSSLYHGFVFLSPIGGWNAVFACRNEFLPQYLGYASSAKNAEINQWVITHLQQTVDGVTKVHGVLSTSAMNGEMYKIGIDTCLNNPVQSIWVLLIKVFALWRPFTVFGAYSHSIFLLSLLLWVPLTIAAIWFLTRRKLSSSGKSLSIYFAVISIAFTLSLLLTPTQIRHRIAFAEPFYWLFFAYFVSFYFEKWKISRT